MAIMCGRFAATTDPAVLAEKLGAINEAVPDDPDATARNYNVAPTDTVAAVVCRHGEPDDEPTRRVRLMRWGLVPPWAKSGPDGTPENSGPLLINARADKVTSSPAFRSSAAAKRCLVPMDGFYEWRADPKTKGAAGKTPFYFYRGDGSLLFAAGLWSAWKPSDDAGPGVRPLLSCTIITTDAVGEAAGIHDRMPLMVDESDWDAWLDPDAPAPSGLLESRPDVRGIRLHAVSKRVNSVANNGPELIAPAEPPAQMELY
jgi:putative SOS response-associated peptidase YedK